VRATMSDAGFGTVHPGMQPGLSRGGARSKVKYDGDIGGRDDDQQLSLSAGSNGSSTTSKHRAIKKRSPSYIEEDDHKDRDYEHEDSMMPFEEYTNEVWEQPSEVAASQMNEIYYKAFLKNREASDRGSFVDVSPVSAVSAEAIRYRNIKHAFHDQPQCTHEQAQKAAAYLKDAMAGRYELGYGELFEADKTA